MKTEEASKRVLENNSFVTNNNGEGAASNIGVGDNNIDHDNSRIFNPMKKLVELYERLLAEEKEKIAVLEQRLLALEKKLEYRV